MYNIVPPETYLYNVLVDEVAADNINELNPENVWAVVDVITTSKISVVTPLMLVSKLILLDVLKKYV